MGLTGIKIQGLGSGKLSGVRAIHQHGLQVIKIWRVHCFALADLGMPRVRKISSTQKQPQIHHSSNFEGAVDKPPSGNFGRLSDAPDAIGLLYHANCDEA